MQKRIRKLFAGAAALGLVFLTGCGTTFARRVADARPAADFSTVFNIAAEGKRTAYQEKVLADMLARHQAQMQDPENRRILDAYLGKFDRLKNASLYKKIKETDRIVDRSIQSLNDWLVAGYDDYWMTPLETLRRGAGDCEDHAILKYFVLKHLGVPEKSLCLVAVSTAEKNNGHAVLVVSTSKGRFALDNQDKKKGGQAVPEKEFAEKEDYNKIWGAYRIGF